MTQRVYRIIRATLFLLVSLSHVPQLSAQYVWLDANGEPLPFQGEEAIEEFLRTATITDEESIGKGVNRSVRVTLVKEGVRAHAIFREVDRRERSIAIGGDHYLFFADSYLFECAAYELGKLIDMPLVPPAVLRTFDRRRGSLQIWVEEVLDEERDDFDPPRPIAWVEQLWDMYLFDNLIYNVDRNPDNILVTPEYRLWLVDHTRAFQIKHELLDDRVVRVRRKSWERLLGLTEDELRETLRPYLTPPEMRGVIERREILKQHVDGLVAERGDAVFY